MSSDTIAAIATAPGSSGLGVIRISGPQALAAAQKIFSPAGPHAVWPARVLLYGKVRTADGLQDEALAVYFPAPHSYTGENVAELQLHGNPSLLSAVLDSCLEAGARQAERGEFTKRAFLNGRIDLTQAEAVAEIISAPSLEGAKLASAKLFGALGTKITELREKTEYLRRRLCLSIDFPEDEGECLPRQEFKDLLMQMIAGCRRLAEGYERAKPWTHGALVVLAGPVNAGKSSLMNAIIGRERAIVTDRAGTTRDYLEESAALDGMPVRLTDTAGLRSRSDMPDDPIEAEGIRRSINMLNEADLILLTLDASAFAEISEAVQAVTEHVPFLTGKKYIILLNKRDISVLTDADIKKISEKFSVPAFAVSAVTGEGIEDICRCARKILSAGEWSPDETAPNERQYKLIRSCAGELERLLHELDSIPSDVAAARLESAAAYLADVTGLCGMNETYEAIFDKFCIGK